MQLVLDIVMLLSTLNFILNQTLCFKVIKPSGGGGSGDVGMAVAVVYVCVYVSKARERKENSQVLLRFSMFFLFS